MRGKLKSGNVLKYFFVEVLLTPRFDCHKEEDLLEQVCFTGNVPLCIPNHISRACGDPTITMFFGSFTIFSVVGYSQMFFFIECTFWVFRNVTSRQDLLIIIPFIDIIVLGSTLSLLVSKVLGNIHFKN